MLKKITTVTITDDTKVVSHRKNVNDVFTYEELDDRAKARVFYRWREGQQSDPDSLECSADNAADALRLLGVDFTTRQVKLMGGGVRHEPRIWYSVGGGQGDGASWEGSYNYQRGAHKAVRREWPQESELHEIADGLLELQQRHGYKLEARVHTHNRWVHSNAMIVSVYKGEEIDCQDLVNLLRRSADWVYSLLQREADYNVSEELFNDMRDTNFLYTENGDYAGEKE